MSLASLLNCLRKGLKLSFSVWILGVLTPLMILLSSTPALAADHLEAPFVRQDGRTDINDMFIFHPGNPQDLSRIVLGMTVNPAAGVMSSTRFNENAIYDLLIDQNGDAIEDLAFRVVFSSPVSGGEQQLNVSLVRSNGSAELLASGLTEAVIEGGRDSLVFAGVRDDPFFFDNDRFNAGATFCFETPPGGVGDNFFAGLNVSAIVIEVPTSLLGSGQISFWGVTRA